MAASTKSTASRFAFLDGNSGTTSYQMIEDSPTVAENSVPGEGIRKTRSHMAWLPGMSHTLTSARVKSGLTKSATSELGCELVDIPVTRTRTAMPSAYEADLGTRSAMLTLCQA